MYKMNDIILPEELRLDDETVLTNVDFIQLLSDLFQMAYKSLETNKAYLNNGKDSKLLNDNIQYILQTNVLVNKIGGRLRHMDEAIIFIRDFYDRDFYDKRHISYVDFAEYHTDMFNSNVSTLKDLCHKLILNIYQKDVNYYNWKPTKNCLQEKANKALLDLFEEAKPLFSYVIDNRNSAEHDGKSDIKKLFDLTFIESMRLFSKKNPNLDHDLVERMSVNLRLTKGWDHLKELVSIRNNLLRFLCRYYHCLYQPFYDTVMSQKEPDMNSEKE